MTTHTQPQPDFSHSRSRRYHPPAIAAGARATSAGLRTPRIDAHGRPYLGRAVRLLGHGHHDAREAERLLLDAAQQEGIPHHHIELHTQPWLQTDIHTNHGPS